MDDFDIKLLNLHNSHRKISKANDVEYSKKLSDVALLNCMKMKQDNKLYHVNPNINENIAYGFKNLYEKPDKLMENWLGSPKHKDNILNKNYRYIGIGFIKDKDDKGYYFSCVFE